MTLESVVAKLVPSPVWAVLSCLRSNQRKARMILRGAQVAKAVEQMSLPRAGNGSSREGERRRFRHLQGPHRARVAPAAVVSDGAGNQLGAYQSAWTAVPLCSVATVPLALHATTAGRSVQLSIASCQCLAMPAGDS